MTLIDTQKLAKFKEEMYSTLLYPHHVVSSNKKLIEFKDDKDGNPIKPMTGFLAAREDRLYLLQSDVKKNLPIRINEPLLSTRVTKTGDVSYIVPKNTTQNDYFVSFRIHPDRMLSYKELLDTSDQRHSCSDAFTKLYGNILYASIISRINVCVAGNVGSGKSSYYDALDKIYDCGPRIEKPSSAPALAPGVSTNGVLFIDELSGLKTKEKKAGVETVINSLASGSDRISYGTAGSKAYRTQNPPPTTHLSCVVVYNLFGSRDDCMLDIKDSPYKPSYYKKQDYFDWMWSNQASVVDRFLRVKLPDGKIDVSQYLNAHDLTDEEKTTLKKMAKTVAYYKECARHGYIKSVEGYPPELSVDDVNFLSGYILGEMGIDKESRYLPTLLEILKLGLIYCEKDREEFKSEFGKIYKQWIDDYYNMINLKKIDDEWSRDNGLVIDNTESHMVSKDNPPSFKVEEINMNDTLEDIL